VLIFAYAPAGLGHLRVTDALYHGLPKSVSPLLLGTQDKSITIIHRFTSIRPIFRDFAEWMQQGLPESLFTRFYRWYLRNNTQILFEQILTLLDQRIDVPDTVLVVATHFGLAHQLCAIKKRIETEKKVNVVVVVQVTDDSPQQLWYVPGADLTFVPSQRTKEDLMRFGKKSSLAPIRIVVTPYPISPLLGESYTLRQTMERKDQLTISGKSRIHVAVPISGAAVGMEFVTKLIDSLYSKSHRFIFHVISKSSPFTEDFLKEMIARSYVELHVSTHDRQIVDVYEQVYRRNIISLEVTKPSEQAFKALLCTHHVGGSILLFSKPVGRQEYDNLHFLKRHQLLPDAKNYPKMDPLFQSSSVYQKNHHTWRGFRIPDDPLMAADAIWKGIETGLFSDMIQDVDHCKNHIHMSEELGSGGVAHFWNEVVNFLSESHSVVD